MAGGQRSTTQRDHVCVTVPTGLVKEAMHPDPAFSKFVAATCLVISTSNQTERFQVEEFKIDWHPMDLCVCVPAS